MGIFPDSIYGNRPISVYRLHFFVTECSVMTHKLRHPRVESRNTKIPTITPREHGVISMTPRSRGAAANLRAKLPQQPSNNLFRCPQLLRRRQIAGRAPICRLNRAAMARRFLTVCLWFSYLPETPFSFLVSPGFFLVSPDFQHFRNGDIVRLGQTPSHVVFSHEKMQTIYRNGSIRVGEKEALSSSLREVRAGYFCCTPHVHAKT